jgi:hypothetical protein
MKFIIAALLALLQAGQQAAQQHTEPNTIPTRLFSFNIQEVYYGVSALLVLGTILWRVYVVSQKINNKNKEHIDAKFKEFESKFEQRIQRSETTQDEFSNDCEVCRKKVSEDLNVEVKRLERVYMESSAGLKSDIVGIQMQARDDHFATEMVRLQYEAFAKNAENFFKQQEKFNEKMDDRLTKLHEAIIKLKPQTSGG